jgi:hypothetical protein
MRIDPFDQFQHPSEYLANATDENKALKRIDKRIGALAHPSNGRRAVWLWAGIAASAVGLLLINTFLINQPAGTDLAMRFFEPYPNYQALTVRGSDDANDLQDAYAVYDQGRYAESVLGFDGAVGLTATDRLYRAIALQGTGQWELSEKELKEIETTIPEDYRHAHTWYRALSLVALSRGDETIHALKDLATGTSIFNQKAQQLLEALE